MYKKEIVNLMSKNLHLMTIRVLLIYVTAAVALITQGGIMPARADDDPGDLTNYSFAVWIGSGVYKVNSANKRFVEAGKKGAFRAAVMTSSGGERELVHVIEDHADGQVNVLLPWVPTAFAGSVKIVDWKRIEILDANLGDASHALSQWGVGVRDLLGKKNA